MEGEAQTKASALFQNRMEPMDGCTNTKSQQDCLNEIYNAVEALDSIAEIIKNQLSNVKAAAGQLTIHFQKG
jgi:hypothetical protein